MKTTTWLAVLVVGMLWLPVAGMAQVTSSGTLTVNAVVAGSINLVFNSNGAGVALSSGAGTNAATLNFGNISAYGSVAGGITRTVGATNFTVSTPVDVLVSSYNTGSANYRLSAQLGAADAVNSWAVGGVAVTNASASSLTASGTYGTGTPYGVALTVPFASASGTAINNTINFVATAN